MKKLILTLAILLSCSSAWATTWYIREDGGTATQCTGTSNNSVASTPNCAMNSPHWIFPSRGESTARAAVDGDTVVVVTAAGSFRVGCQNATDCRDTTKNLTNSSYCDDSWPYDCYMGTIPDNVTIVGCSATGCTSSADKPEFWGAGRIGQVISVAGSSGVTIKDLIITDYHDCGTGKSGYDCANSSSTLAATDGINIQGATNLTLTNVNIHGLRRYGLCGGSVNGMTVTNTNIDYNSYGGWSADDCGGGSMSGTITFQSGSTIRYNGCVEDNPGYGTIVEDGCYSQDQGGYGDGIGTGSTGGTWVFTDVDFSHNVSDGLDLLYATSAASVSIKRSLFEGNAGNQVKIPNNAYIEDSFIIGNCGYFNTQTFTQQPGFNNCRAAGTPLAISFKSSASTPKIYNNTILSNGDVGILTTGACTTGTDVFLKNNVLIGGTEFNDGSDLSSIYYEDQSYGTCNPDLMEDYNFCYGWKEGANSCNGSNSLDGTTVPSSTFTGTITQGPGTYYTGSSYISELFLHASSTARGVSDESLSGADALDYNSYNRGSVWDAGAYEYGTSGDTPSNCGNGDIDSGEDCDGSNLNGADCVSLGYDSGTLSCSACSFVTSGCSSSTPPSGDFGVGIRGCRALGVSIR